MRKISYELFDVLTDRPLAGNALAVFTDADGLDGATIQALAREKNVFESSFVLSPDPRRCERRNPHLYADDGASVCRPPYICEKTAFVLAARRRDKMVALKRVAASSQSA